MSGGADAVIQIGGPWNHGSVSANDIRFHAAEAGDGPLVLLLHGFPEFWWTWRHQLAVLPGAGFRAVAVDLRGYGGSVKPPRGYDLVTAASDAAGLVRALGEANAIVVGHGLGGLVAWTLAAYYPKVVRRLAVISMAHPLRMRASVVTNPLGQGRRSGYALPSQLPIWPERQLLKDGAYQVGRLLEKWSAPGWPGPETEQIYERAMRIPSAAHSALEYHRWLARSGVRPDGLRYARHMRTPIAAPVLHLHGAVDTCVLPRTARGAGRYVDGPYRWRVIDGAGHFPHDGRPFHAHEVLEAAWKSGPAGERDLWQGLAQIAVGLTHARRGNARGAVALLSRGAERVRGYQGGAGSQRAGGRLASPFGMNVALFLAAADD